MAFVRVCEKVASKFRQRPVVWNKLHQTTYKYFFQAQ